MYYYINHIKQRVWLSNNPKTKTNKNHHQFHSIPRSSVHTHIIVMLDL